MSLQVLDIEEEKGKPEDALMQWKKVKKQTLADFSESGNIVSNTKLLLAQDKFA